MGVGEHPWCPESTPGGNPSQVSALDALWKEQTHLAPGTQILPAGTISAPQLPASSLLWNKQSACDPGPGSQEFLADAAVTPLRAECPLVVLQPTGAGFFWLEAPTPLGLQQLSCPSLLESIRGNRVVRSWASHFTSFCLGFLNCKTGIIAQSSWDC